MWIRTNDRLMKCDRFFLGKNGRIYGSNGEMTPHILGEYGEECYAEEVLNEIQTYIEDNISSVYEMPRFDYYVERG